MSGIEVAGLVLGACPLIITGLEKWQKALEVYDEYWLFKSGFQRCRDDIRGAEVALLGNIERLLLTIALEESEIQVLLNNTKDEKWKDQELEDKLKQKLPNSYRHFLQTIKRLEENLIYLAATIGAENPDVLAMVESEETPKHVVGAPEKRSFKTLFRKPKKDPMQQVPTNKRNIRVSFEVQKQRVRFALSKERRKRYLEDIDRLNNELKNILDTSDVNDQLKRSLNREAHGKNKRNSHLTSMWRHARQFYELLQKALSCDCRDMHLFFLRLISDVDTTKVQFYIKAIYSQSRTMQQFPWKERSLTVKKVAAETTRSSNAGTMDQSAEPSLPKNTELPMTRNSHGATLKPALRKPQKNSKSSENGTRHTNPGKPLTVGFASNKSDGQQAAPKLEATDEVLIHDLCTWLRSCPSGTSFLGNLQNQEAIFALYADHEHIENSRCHTISLGRMLRHESNIHLNRRQRYFLALTIASSHLQFFSSAWLNKVWSKEDILFQFSEINQPTEFEEPYISRYISRDVPDTQTVTSNTSSQALETLGILLIELCHGSVLEAHDKWKQLSFSSSHQQNNIAELKRAVDIYVAKEWSHTVKHEAGQPYYEAVQWCLMGKPVEGNDKQWRREFVEKVIEPLKFCDEQFRSKQVLYSNT